MKKPEGIISLGAKMGEGLLLTAEMLELVEGGYGNIVCAQPFGCLPNHIVGKGMINKIRALHPEANITPVDYDPSAKATRRFFAAIQNKLHYSVHGQTAAEVVYNRADAEKEHMGLTNWDGYPDGKIHKSDVVVAKNYLTEEELHQLSRLVSAYLDLAEMQAERKIPMTMADWEQRLNGFLTMWDRDVLQDAGKISAEMAKIHAETEFEKYRIVQDQLYNSNFDRF